MQSWPFMLIITSAEHDATSRLEERYRTYRPKSDFSIWSSGLPRLLVVNSTQPGNELMPFDQVRLLLAGASVVRFANRGVAEYSQETNFVLVCVYVEDNGTTVRYLLFQNSRDSAVYYTKDTFLVSKSQDRVIFARDLHNLSYMLGRSPEDNDTKMRVNEFTQDVWTAKRYYNLPSAHSSFTKSKNKRRRPNEDDHEDNNGGGTRGESAHADEDEGALLRSIGYGVEPDIYVDESGGEWGSLCEYPAHILSVYKLSDRRMRFIAKKVRKGSDELKILQLLKTTKPTCDHVIHLYDWVSSPSESWIILPEMTPIANYLSIKLHPYTARVCSGLIYGLAYLHRLSIAHCDIKPANIVVDRYFCPKIIDFDCAIQLKDEDEEVVGSCGTEGWTAPEVSDSSLYSPLRADRWSCGHVILYLLNKAKTDGGRLRAFALKLEAIDPRRRPTLADWPVLESAPVTESVQTIRPHSVIPEAVETPVAKKRKLRTQHSVDLLLEAPQHTAVH
ncbi:kinase-like domain-containing protein [Cytidiella melzeri]|nr:kinase-like domain-containing protein [Cytidiella melzeri]